MGNFEVDTWPSPLWVFLFVLIILSSAWRMDQGCLVEGERTFGEKQPRDLAKVAAAASCRGDGAERQWGEGHMQVASGCDIAWVSIFPFPFQYFPNSRRDTGKMGEKCKRFLRDKVQLPGLGDGSGVKGEVGQRYGLNVWVPPRSMGWSPTPSHVMAFGDGPLGGSQG